MAKAKKAATAKVVSKRAGAKAASSNTGEPELFGGLDMDAEPLAEVPEHHAHDVDLEDIDATPDDVDNESDEASDVDLTDEAPTDAPDVADGEEPEEPAPSSAKTAARAAKDPKRAAKRLKNAVARLEKFDWDALSADGVKGALAMLRNAIPKLEARSAPRQTKLAEGALVQVREKYVGRYADFFAAEDLKNLRVKKLANRSAQCVTARKTEVLFPVAALEAQPS